MQAPDSHQFGPARMLPGGTSKHGRGRRLLKLSSTTAVGDNTQVNSPARMLPGGTSKLGRGRHLLELPATTTDPADNTPVNAPARMLPGGTKKDGRGRHLVELSVSSADTITLSTQPSNQRVASNTWALGVRRMLPGGGRG